MPVARTVPPGNINIPGPGPPVPREPSPLPPSKSTNGVAKKEVSPDPTTGLIDVSASQESHEDGDDDAEDEDYASPAERADPYADLDGAFGGYTADEPRPQVDSMMFRTF